MQNRYVADIGDYVKFAILRALSRGRRLGLVWWLFPDESHNADGGHRAYLERPKEWERFDPPLFGALRRISQEKSWNVRAIERAAIFPDAVFASIAVPCEVRPFSLRPGERRKWIEGIKDTVSDCDFVFLDPDNGIAPARLKLTQRRAGKSVTIEEIKEPQYGNRTVIVYHHQTRLKGGHDFEIEDLFARLRNSGLHVTGALRAKPWSPRVFFILNGDEETRDRAKKIVDLWGKWITWRSEVP
jgi:hypothetical protein